MRALAIAFALLAPAGPAPRTALHVYRPFAAGRLAGDVRVARTARGYCWTSSGAAVRPDAWRCFVGNVIHDPCFSAGQTVTYVVCPLYRPRAPVVRIDLTRKLPKPIAQKGGAARWPPWAVQTAGGRWCTFLIGATGEIAGKRVDYGCESGGLLVGLPDRSSASWRISFARRFDSSRVTPVALRQAWW